MTPNPNSDGIQPGPSRARWIVWSPASGVLSYHRLPRTALKARNMARIRRMKKSDINVWGWTKSMGWLEVGN